MITIIINSSVYRFVVFQNNQINYADHFFPEYPIEPQTTIPTDAQPALFFFKNLNNISVTSFNLWIL